MTLIVDAYAGPGGWSEGLAMLGLSDVGLEWDASACATRAAAGHRTIRCDMADYPPVACDAFIGSPPCPTFSAAGRGEGRERIPRLLTQVLHGDWSTDGLDDRTRHVLTIGPWIDLGPETILLEQVPAVLPIWKAYAHLLGSRGFSAWAGVLNAANFGVPQTRRRAFLIASRVRKVAPPRATHDKHAGASLFDLSSWVSMADALGWGLTGRPSNSLVTRASGGGTPGEVLDGGSGARRMHQAEMTEGRFQVRTRGESGRATDEFDGQEVPSRMITGKSDSWDLDRRTNSRGPGGSTVPTATVGMDRPAPTMTAIAGGQWVFREAPEEWVHERPATTLMADDRLSPPGRHDPTVNDSQHGPGTIKLQVPEALILQSFRPDYPVQGSKSKQFEQIGNAVPPLLAAHVAAAGFGIDWP